MKPLEKLDDRARCWYEWAVIILMCLIATIVLVGIGVTVYRRAEAERRREEASLLRKQEGFEDVTCADERRRLERKNEAWARCKSDGNRPVMGGLYVVVCLKHESVAWEQAVQ